MRRNPIEVDMSMRRIGKGQGQTPRLYQGYQDRIQIILENRSDVNLTILDYGDVIDDPDDRIRNTGRQWLPNRPEAGSDGS